MHPPPHTSPVCDLCQSVRLTLWPCCSADRQEMTSSALAKTSCESCSFFVYAWWNRAHEHHGLPFFQTETNDFPAIGGNPVTVGLLVCYSIHRIIMYILCTLKYTLYYTSTLAYTLYHTYSMYISIHTVYVNTYTVIMGPTGSSMRGFRLFLGQCTETLFLGQYTETLFLGQCIPRQLLIFLNPRIFEYQIF